MADLGEIQGLLSNFEPTAEDKAAARRLAQQQFFLGLLGARRGDEFGQIGRAGLLANASYQDQIKNLQTQRGQNITQAAALQKMQKEAQFQQLATDMMNGNGIGGGAPAGAAPGGANVQTAPLAPQGSPQQPMQPQQQPGTPSWANPRVEMAMGLAGKNDVADIIHRQYNMTQGPGGTLIRGGSVVGQVIPNAGMMIDGKFEPLPKEATDALVNFNAANARGTEQAKADMDLIPVPMGNGQTQMMTRADAARMFSQGQPQQQPQQPQMQRPGMNMAAPDDATAYAMARAADKSGQQVTMTVPPRASGVGGPMGTTPNPLAMKQAEMAIGTQAAQNTAIGEGQAKDYLSVIDAERAAPGNIAKYELMKNYLGKIETGKLAPSVLGLKSVAAYIAPNLAKEWTKDVPYAQASASLSNEIALQLRNPQGGAGMPGSMSDSDRNFLVSMTANSANDPRAIPLMLDARIAMEKRSQEVGKLARDYRQQNGRIDEGFYQQLQDWSNAHPMFKGIDPGASGSASGPLSPAEQQELQALRKKLGR